MTKLLSVEELNQFMKRLGVYHDLWCARLSDKTTEAVITDGGPGFITENKEELSLFGRAIITNSGEELSLGGPKN